MGAPKGAMGGVGAPAGDSNKGGQAAHGTLWDRNPYPSIVMLLSTTCRLLLPDSVLALQPVP
jgi:hypothetical protein